MLIFLGGFLYFGVWLNLIILNIYIPAEVHFYILLGIAVLVCIQGILNYMKYSSYRYLFYKDRMIFQGKNNLTILYSEIKTLDFKKNALDYIFNTGIINIYPKHQMNYVENTNQIYFYMQKLIDYSRQLSGYAQQQNTYQQNQVYYKEQLR